MSELASPASVKVNGLSLVVPYYAQTDQAAAPSWFGTLLKAAISVPKRRFATLLDDVSFTINEGERVALVGRNGAGKSTMLRILAGAYEPTSGSLEMQGSKQALLSIGLGFNPEATVTENIFLRASAMGVGSGDIQNLVDPVLDFSGLRAVANRKLMTLSSGQKMRLGFAISTARHTDIMLLDEWFGAGDAQFLKHARQRLMDRLDGSKIVVLASHNNSLLKNLCNRAILLDGGKVVLDGSVSEVLKEYRRLHPVAGSSTAKGRKRSKIVGGQADVQAWKEAKEKAWASSLDERAQAWKEAKEKAWASSLEERAQTWKEAKQKVWASSLDERARMWKEAKEKAWASSLDVRAQAWVEAKARARANLRAGKASSGAGESREDREGRKVDTDRPGRS